MKYEYGVEYQTNGNEPCLADDIVVEQYSTADEKWHKGAVCCWNWGARTITKFRIVDERYKPKPKDNTWFERGELPPVGIECEVECNSAEIKKQFHRVVPVFYSKSLAIFEDVRGGEFAYFIKCCKFRPTKTEREKTIEAAKELIKAFDIPPAVCGALYDAGLLRLPEGK